MRYICDSPILGGPVLREIGFTQILGISLCSLWLPSLEEALDDRFGTAGQGCVVFLGLERPGSDGPGGLLLGWASAPRPPPRLESAYGLCGVMLAAAGGTAAVDCGTAV